jgi:hypothetical protein
MLAQPLARRLARPLARRIVRSGDFLPETFAFAAASGATDLQPLDNLFRYVIGAGLWSNFRIYPQKSAQNAGSGSTVYGAGGLTANNGTLIGSPTWGAGGITFNTSTQLMRISDFLGTSTLTVWVRRNGALANGGAAIAQWDAGTNDRSIQFFESTAAAGGTNSQAMLRSADGTNNNAVPGLESFRTGVNETWPTTDATQVVQWVDGGARFLWVNNTSTAITTATGSATAQNQRFNTSVDVTQNANLNNNSPGSFLGGEFTALAFLEGPEPTTTQRETITNLINAL